MINCLLINYQGEKIDLKGVDSRLIYKISVLNEILFQRYGASIVVHCIKEGQHVENSYHYKGMAIDFHVSGMSYKRAFSAIYQIINELKWNNIIGFGLYPQWNYQGFHLDVRGERARWSKINNEYCSYEKGIEYINEKCA